MFAMILVNLLLHRWFVYCYWHFGLVYAEIREDVALFKDVLSVFDIYEDACRNQKVRYTIDLACPDVCHNIDNLRTADKVMLVFGVLSLLSILCSVTFHTLLILNRRLTINKFIYIFDFLPSFFFVLGFFLFIQIADFQSYEPTVDISYYGVYEPDDLSYKAGYAFAIANSVIVGAFVGLSCIVSYKTRNS
eukprot:CAMPEP_0204915806 /NCGR_PEP_ID=MMETSP1397-20131031/13749_1 /ASSEMBLY_ACC=CAM_ASM_000891 /TAXON_ID=49980 /ORGANISM="Climacostomum Climacostomum virens, Strain Stock W-24" /LENGTH=190 /DNA_ID=CAMNT_0052088023 /DNA_START=1 /DNA_END=573 /DNA_ORIENTATION=+